jgi:hypothetical protein
MFRKDYGFSSICHYGQPSWRVHAMLGGTNPDGKSAVTNEEIGQICAGNEGGWTFLGQSDS